MRRHQAARRRMVWLLGLLALPALALAAAGCTQSSQAAAPPPPGMAVVVFVDFSASIGGGERLAFRREIDKLILPSLQPGDGFILAPIHDRTFTAFRPLVEGELPPRAQFNGWFNNVMKFNRESKETDAKISQIKESLRTQTAAALGQSVETRYTDIFSSLLLAEKLFAAESRRKVLVLMSDMIEDHPPYAFDRMTWKTDTTQKILTDLQARRLMPNLKGVCVYVSGVSAPSAELARNIAVFWEAYFFKAGADLHASRYAHVLLHWPPSASCRPPTA